MYISVVVNLRKLQFDAEIEYSSERDGTTPDSYSVSSYLLVRPPCGRYIHEWHCALVAAMVALYR